MKKNLIGLVIVLFVSAIVLVACGDTANKAPAEVAIKAAEEAINASKAEAVKYSPNEVKSLEDALAAAKDKFAKKEYNAALEDAKGIPDKAKGLLEAAKAKKEELTKNWADLSQEIPKMVDAAQTRVDILSKSKKLPADLTQEKFDEVKSGLAAAKEEWTKALDSFKAGNLAEAVSAAGSVKEKATAALEGLGMPVPGAEKK